MYHKDHITLAKAVRDSSARAGLDEDSLKIMAEGIAGACESRGPNFDRETFMAFALSPVLED